VADVTPRARALLDYVQGYWQWRGYGPTLAEATAAIGSRTKNTQNSTLGWLLKRGYLEKPPGKRTLRPVEKCPCCGRGP